MTDRVLSAYLLGVAFGIGTATGALIGGWPGVLLYVASGVVYSIGFRFALSEPQSGSRRPVRRGASALKVHQPGAHRAGGPGRIGRERLRMAPLTQHR
jgi:hypothetical protein